MWPFVYIAAKRTMVRIFLKKNLSFVSIHSNAVYASIYIYNNSPIVFDILYVSTDSLLNSILSYGWITTILLCVCLIMWWYCYNLWITVSNNHIFKYIPFLINEQMYIFWKLNLVYNLHYRLTFKNATHYCTSTERFLIYYHIYFV